MAQNKPRDFSRLRLQGFFGTRQFYLKQDSAHVRAHGPSPVAARAFSGKWLFALIVLAFIISMSYGTLNRFFTQNAEINQVKANIASLEAKNKSLAEQQSWWQDENYVRQQAKSRLFYVNEGEVPYLVVGADYTTQLKDQTSAEALTAPEDSWTTKLWNSFQLSAVNGDTSGQEPRNVPTTDGEAPAQSTAKPATGR